MSDLKRSHFVNSTKTKSFQMLILTTRAFEAVATFWRERRSPLTNELYSLGLRRVVVQIRSEPSLDFGDAHPFTLVVVVHLIAVDLSEAEIP
jgi:hypothetical protein